MQEVHQRFAAAHRKSGKSLAGLQAALKKDAGLTLSVPSIWRKLNGQRKFRDREIEAFARTLRIKVTRTVVTLGRAA